jgi:DNA replication ATP-dependent helicase Dna2
MPQLLNDLETLYYYDNLTHIAHRPADDETAKLRALHPIFLSVINALTEQREKQIFNGWFAKISFIVQAYGLEEGLADELQSLRRLLYKAVGNPRFSATENQWFVSLKLTAEFVALFSDQEIPEKIKEIYKNLQLPQLHFKEKPAQIIPAFYANLAQKGELQHFEANAQKYGEIMLTCESEEYGKMQIYVRDITKFSAYTLIRHYELAQHCATLLHPNQTLYLTNIAKSTQNNINHNDNIDFENLWETTDETLLVASPEYLMDASVLARCIINGAKYPTLYLLNKLRFFIGSEATFKGNMLNDMLDEYIETGKDDYRENFEKTFREHLVDAISMNWEDSVFTKMYNDARADLKIW